MPSPSRSVSGQPWDAPEEAQPRDALAEAHLVTQLRTDRRDRERHEVLGARGGHAVQHVGSFERARIERDAVDELRLGLGRAQEARLDREPVRRDAERLVGARQKAHRHRVRRVERRGRHEPLGGAAQRGLELGGQARRDAQRIARGAVGLGFEVPCVERERRAGSLEAQPRSFERGRVERRRVDGRLGRGVRARTEREREAEPRPKGRMARLPRRVSAWARPGRGEGDTRSRRQKHPCGARSTPSESLTHDSTSVVIFLLHGNL